jgi:hypothetical protein
VNRVLAIILFLSLSFQSMVKLGIVAWYEVNKTYVATVLCENKDKPEMKCCGKCYVNKQMNKVDRGSNSDKQLPGKTAKAETVDYIMPFTQSQNIVFSPQENKIFNGHYTGTAGFELVTSVFHPPPVGC